MLKSCLKAFLSKKIAILKNVSKIFFGCFCPEDWKFCYVSNDVMKEGDKHYAQKQENSKLSVEPTKTCSFDLNFWFRSKITIWMKCKYDGIPKNPEPDKCEEWIWMSWQNAQKEKPDKFFVPLAEIFQDKNFDINRLG